MSEEITPSELVSEESEIDTAVFDKEINDAIDTFCSSVSFLTNSEKIDIVPDAQMFVADILLLVKRHLLKQNV
jgi:hypothetical protein